MCGSWLRWFSGTCFALYWLTGEAGGPIPGNAAEPPRAQRGPAAELTNDEPSMFFTQTLGGRQFWGDVRFFHEWRIQRNVFTGHYRLLDGKHVRQAFGSLEHCEQELAKKRQQLQLPPMRGKGVIVLHGLIRSSAEMKNLSVAIREEGWTPFTVDYPSTRVTIPEAADYLRQVIDSLEGIEEIDIIAHSMGGLVTRAYFQQNNDPRIKRVVMLGVPNYGAQLADRFRWCYPLRWAMGPGACQLVTDPDGLIHTLPPPPCEFAIISGARGDDAGLNPLIRGDDDGTVTVESTKLAGASDFITVPVLHPFLTRNPLVIQHTLRFLKTGAIRESGEREPLAAKPMETGVVDR